MSVPRPAMLVATVIWPGSPAQEMISASWRSCSAFRTLASRPAAASSSLRCSESLTVRVPTSTGLPLAWSSAIRFTTASHFSSAVRWSRGGSPRRIIGFSVGTATTWSRYTDHSSCEASLAVPVIPASAR